MSVVVRGMEMPENCGECPLEDYYYHTCLAVEDDLYCEYDKRPEKCPLFEVKAWEEI